MISLFIIEEAKIKQRKKCQERKPGKSAQRKQSQITLRSYPIQRGPNEFRNKHKRK